MFRLLSALLLSATFVLGGCANRLSMPLQEDGATPNPAKHLALLTLDLRNDYRERYQPVPWSVTVVQKVDGNETAFNFPMDRKGSYWGEKDENPVARYLVRLELQPGPYEIRGVSMGASAFPFNASMFLPLLAPVTGAAGEVVYLGNVTANVRERQGNEFRAGAVIPLLDQSAAGASGGTWEVTISDKADADLALFRKRFTGLEKTEIKRAVLPPFDRAKVQAWWEKN